MTYEVYLSSKSQWVVIEELNGLPVECRGSARYASTSLNCPVREVDACGLILWEVYQHPTQGSVEREPFEEALDEDEPTIPGVPTKQMLELAGAA